MNDNHIIDGTFHNVMCICKDTGFRTHIRGGHNMRRLKPMSKPEPFPFVYEFELPCNCSQGEKVNMIMGYWEDIPGTKDQVRRPRYTPEQIERIHREVTWFDNRADGVAFVLECKRMFAAEQENKPEVLK